ncbi:xanthine dehydrogenase family protein molybdopterin-binding subunit [Pseudoprimorskyibacter insulae]|uniref:Isoquinoline 1-oxidoreductase subunit beta n=1 Tax=Pseudoprimorskyibacter insulae TaxID=1695997 RepID=A0A2R8AX43_9RHOB|nr:molybdopterin cofactor-binding domain-containing protein [Pseudoprimorskyibacter insulae]SPF80593.1 Isoquinoline 1-oxidoreductase subunit beta [Pseudoprimorskyibacter insulae]
MSRIGKIARRTFLIGSAAVVGGVAIGAWYVSRPAPNPLTPQEGEASLNAFVVIDGNGVTLVAPRAEMGQGVRTTWAALLAEELDVNWEDIKVIHGPAAAAYYNSAMMASALPGIEYRKSEFTRNLGEALGVIGKVFEMQITGGSTAMRDGYERMRATGAAAREMLKEAAAKRLDVKARDLRTEGGAVIAPDGTRLTYSELAADAAAQDPRDVALRDPSQWRYLGKSLPRVDIVEKSTGTATFGIDVRVEGMKFAALKVSPRRGAMNGFDASAARTMPGVEQIVDVGDGVAVVASNTWLAMQALEAITFDWGPAPYPATTDAIFAPIAAALGAEPTATPRDDGDASTVPDGATVVEADYSAPYLAHATMEPMNATALIDADGLTIWAGNQGPTILRDRCAEVAGLDADQVTVHTTYMGGGFGRRGEVDFGQYATRVAMALPGVPVQLTWSREEDMTHDFYRPGTMARMRGAVKNGTAVMLDAQVASPSPSQQALKRWMGFAPGGPDNVITEGLANQPYAIPNYRCRNHQADVAVPIGFWRSVGNSHNGFYMESFMDEMAHAAGADPLDFRLDLARREWAPAAGVLQAVKDMSGWTGQTPDGTGRGVAMCYAFGTPVATVIEVQDEGGAIRIAKAWMACDPGIALDPSIIEAQMFGGLVYGLSAAMSEEITFDNGIAQQENFPDYEALRIHQMPQVEVRILETLPHISGVGEPGTPGAAPALANALFDLTGKRARQLPLNKMFDFI